VNTISYLEPVLFELIKTWPDNKTINIVCHGHSVPAGYFATPLVNSFEAYPHLLHRILKERFPFAVVNVIVSAIGGETSAGGAERFEKDVLNHSPSVITIDYGLNDRGMGLENARRAWQSMIEKALTAGIKIILLTPSWDTSYFSKDKNWDDLVSHAKQIRVLAEEYQTGLADSFQKFEEYVKTESDLTALLSHSNHPSSLGHNLIAAELVKFFIAHL